jgi:hypothetical protein
MSLEARKRAYIICGLGNTLLLINFSSFLGGSIGGFLCLDRGRFTAEQLFTDEGVKVLEVS